MKHSYAFATCSVALLLASPSLARAEHDIHAFLSERGVAFVEQNASSFVPTEIQPLPYEKAVGCMDFEQRNTTVNLSLDRLDIQMPFENRVRVELDLSIDATGELYVDDLYACLGEATCQDSLSLENASAVIDLDVEVFHGIPEVSVRNVEVELDPDRFDFALSGCGVTGSALTSVVDFAEDWLLYFAEVQIASIAERNLAPMVESMLSGLSTDGSYVAASIDQLSFPNGGVSVVAKGGLKEKYDAAECIRQFDEGPPLPEFGAAAPDLAGASSTDLGVAVNIGLVNQALYAVWHRGMMCLSDGHLAELGVELDLQHVAALLPGFPAGTALDMELTFTRYPKVKSTDSEAAELTLVIEGLELDLHGDTPDGKRKTLHAELDVEATAKLVVDPTTNSIHVQLLGAEIVSMQIKDERSATEKGYDVARIQQMVHESILPKILEEVESIPVSGSVFSVANFAILLKSVTTNAAYLSAGIDLFSIPEVDDNAPETQILEAPSSVANPHTARLLLGGADAEIPAELLQYEVAINGVPQEQSFIRELRVGEMGVTQTYEVSVAAVDLNGNVDQTPATTTVLVDGVVPFVVVSGARTRSAEEGPVEVRWNMSDDRTDASALEVRVEIYDLEDPADALSARLIDTQVLAAGATSSIVDLQNPGGVYRVEVHVVDEAGNDSKSSLLLTAAQAGACSAGGNSTGRGLLLLLALVLPAIRRRRARA